MDCFIKKIFSDNLDESVHAQFVRFGKGIYKGKAALSLSKTTKVKLKGSFEYANDFAKFVSEFNAKFSGIVISKEKLKFDNEKIKAGLHHYEITDVSNEEIKDIADTAYYLLLDAEGPGISLKTKKKLPKPGKSETAKIDDGFCQLEADLKYWDKIHAAFVWDIPDCKKCKIQHEYHISSLEFPKGEKDFAKIRLLTKRKGKIKRKISLDGKELEKEKDFAA